MPIQFKVVPVHLLLLIAALLVAPGALAAPDGPVIGKVVAMFGDVTGTDADGNTFAVEPGAELYKGYGFETGSRAFVRAEMTDGTRFMLGRNGSATLDEFEYDPAAQRGRFDTTIRRGGFQYKSGGIGKLAGANRSDHTRISTPTAVIGIRGSEAEGIITENSTVVTMTEGLLTVTNTISNRSVTLSVPGNTAELQEGETQRYEELPQEVQQQIRNALPTPEQEQQAATQGGEEQDEDEQQDEQQDEDEQQGDQEDGDDNRQSDDDTDDESSSGANIGAGNPEITAQLKAVRDAAIAKGFTEEQADQLVSEANRQASSALVSGSSVEEVTRSVEQVKQNVEDSDGTDDFDDVLTDVGDTISNPSPTGSAPIL